MLLYKQDGSLYCVTKKALQLAGFQTLADFLAEYRDYSELFVKKPGYIYNFENFSWINFLKHATPQQRKVLLKNRDGAVFACDVEIETYLPLEAPSDKAVEYYEVSLKNVTLLDDNGQIAGTAQPVFDALSPADEALTEELSAMKTADEGESEGGETAETSLDLDLAEALSATTGEAADLAADFSVLEETETEEEKTVGKPLPTDLAVTPIDLDAPPTPDKEEKETGQKESEEAPFAVVDISLAASGDKEPKEQTAPLPFDIDKIARLIGFDRDQTLVFLEEFLALFKEKQTAIETALSAGEIPAVHKEILRIKGIAGNLMLEDVEKICDEILHTDASEKIGELFHTLSSTLSLQKKKSEATPPPTGEQHPQSAADIPLREENEAKRPDEGLLDDDDMIPLMTDEEPTDGEAPALSSTPEPAPATREKEGSEPILFDPKAAADALGLPADLILEFTHDFITQCHDEKENFHRAMEAEDLESVHATAHKLKGVAANLRIENLRELLKKIQYSENIQIAQALVQKLYDRVTQLEKQMKEMS